MGLTQLKDLLSGQFSNVQCFQFAIADHNLASAKFCESVGRCLKQAVSTVVDIGFEFLTLFAISVNQGKG